MLKRERVHRHRYQTVAQARTHVFDYIERFSNRRVDRRIEAEDRNHQEPVPSGP
ncbi:IS3 family transposase [Salinisphaera aquimarina]|uniref:IS3 family transposase n=1 Tax=Salinisphaera aquimarina TaxID=2094031 RepID=A0ABV7EQK4_9GAMM